MSTIEKNETSKMSNPSRNTAEMRVLSTTAILGYGFPMASFEAGMAMKPHVIAVDAGSTDPGPYYLGSGISFTDRTAVKRDLHIMIEAGIANNIPVLVGSTGGAGADPHLAWGVEIVREIAKELGLNFKMAIIPSEFDKAYLVDAYENGRIRPLEPAKPITAIDIQQSSHIAGQMGIEPFIEALEGGAQVIMAGRAYDPTVFAALAIKEGYDEGLALHMGKILECASIAATPGSGSDCMMGFLGEDYFDLEPLNPARKCTTLSVAAHTLYEKTNPYILPGPGGYLDLHETSFEQLTDRRVRVKGTKFHPSPKYTIKLEGATLKGYRTVSIAGTRDPIMIEQMDEIIQAVRERVADNFAKEALEYYLDFKIYGKNGVMGNLEPVTHTLSHELGIVIEAVAKSQEIASTICSFARSTMLHYGYTGRISTAGNLAFPYSPSDFKAGEVYVFSLYHLIEFDTLEDMRKAFPVRYEMSLEEGMPCK